jgi:ribosomal protein S12 methylthiotransferase
MPPFFMEKTFSIISLGCPRNLVDSEYITAEFKNKDYTFKEGIEKIDTLIINTCAFIEDAKKESIDTILKAIDAKKEGSIKRIIVTGCLSQRYPEELKKELKEVDEFRGVLAFKASFNEKKGIRLTPAHYTYVKISEGCRNYCTYCVIPHIKGPYKSRPMESIIEEVETLVKRGVREIILVGQDTTLYGIDLYKSKKLADLLKRLARISGDFWLRFLYCHPANLERDVIKVIRDTRRICKYIDLPVEHINDGILKKMGRRIKKAEIISLIDYIRKEIPNLALRTSLIVGFPGETEKDFQELLSFIKDIRFERLGLFRYSREESTAAYKFGNQVSEKEKEARFDEAMLLQQEISKGINERFKDRVLKVLLDEKEKDCYTGRSEYDAPEVDGCVYLKGADLKVGNFYNVHITDTYEYDLVGDVVQGETSDVNILRAIA